MEQIVEVRAVVRMAMLDRVVRTLKESGVPRLTVAQIHAIGAGVDPASTKLSFAEGSVYSDKAEVKFICPRERWRMFAELVQGCSCTGRRGDGIISIHPVNAIINIRTGTQGLEGLG